MSFGALAGAIFDGLPCSQELGLSFHRCLSLYVRAWGREVVVIVALALTRAFVFDISEVFVYLRRNWRFLFYVLESVLLMLFVVMLNFVVTL